ncbi:hypothetical protein ACFVGN_31920 [Streptomyces sp. NPDC057757]|uniref:hypothetical protein n=1 Tax=Streptomyces sp. NPDC057757 TaxID=3346241 RepID=UPI00369BC10C
MLVSTLVVGAISSAATPASAATQVHREDFSNGLGAYTASGSVSTSTGAALPPTPNREIAP